MNKMMTKTTDLPASLTVLYHFRHIINQVAAQVSASNPTMTPNEINLLLHLGNPQRMSDLAKMLDSQPPNMTALVNTCQQAGWVKKTRSKQDARIVLVELTKQGREYRTQLTQEISTQILAITGLSEDKFEKILTLLAEP